jgi:hypothetical protein
VRDAEDIVSRTILKTADKKKGVQDFLAIHGNDAEAHALLRDGILDNFSKATMRSGEFNPKAARNWLNQHKSAMDELLELRKHLENHQAVGQTPGGAESGAAEASQEDRSDVPCEGCGIAGCGCADHEGSWGAQPTARS